MIDKSVVDRLEQLNFPDWYIQSWRYMEFRNSTKSWNFSAAAFGSAWLAYHGLLKYSAIYLPTHLLFLEFTVELTFPYFSILINVLIFIRLIILGRSANYLLYRQLAPKTDEEIEKIVTGFNNKPFRINYVFILWIGFAVVACMYFLGISFTATVFGIEIEIGDTFDIDEPLLIRPY